MAWYHARQFRCETQSAIEKILAYIITLNCVKRILCGRRYLNEAGNNWMQSR